MSFSSQDALRIRTRLLRQLSTAAITILPFEIHQSTIINSDVCWSRSIFDDEEAPVVAALKGVPSKLQ
jgi:hypothetical protein